MVMTDVESDEFYAWLTQGIERKWISNPFCATHEIGPLREWEERRLDDGHDPCIIQSRIWVDGMDDTDPWK